jgi:curli biogenesis system outer membrane secretion channel CsgG
MRISVVAQPLVLAALALARPTPAQLPSAVADSGRPALAVEPFEFAAPRPAAYRVPPPMPGYPGVRRPMPPVLSPFPISRTVANDGSTLPPPPPMPRSGAVVDDGMAGVGIAVADLVTERLLATGRVAIVDRGLFDAEVARSAGAGDSLSAVVAAARRMGVRYIVRGSVVEFGSDERRVGAGGGGSLSALGGVFLKRRKTRVVLVARLVHVETGFVVATARGEGESKKGGSIAGGGIGGGVGGVLGTSDDARSSGPSEAMGRAVDALAAELAARFDRGAQ